MPPSRPFFCANRAPISKKWKATTRPNTATPSDTSSAIAIVPRMSASLLLWTTATQVVPSLTFFATSATIIPVLLIALIFQARLFEIPRHGRGRGDVIAFFAWIALATFAEGMNLVALIRGKGSLDTAQAVAAVVTFLGLVVFAPTLATLLDRWDAERLADNKRDFRKHVWIAYGVCSFALAVVALFRA